MAIEPISDGFLAIPTESATTDWSLTFPSGLSFGDFIVVTLNMAVTQGAATTPVTQGLILVNSDSASGTTSTTETYYYRVPETAPATLDWTLTVAQRGSITWAAFSGVSWGRPIDVFDIATFSENSLGNDFDAPAITTTVGNAYVISILNMPSGSKTVTVPDGYTSLVQATERIGCIASLGVVASAGSVAAAEWSVDGGAIQGSVSHIALTPMEGSVVIFDTFTDDDDTRLNAHTPDEGSTPTELTSYIFGGTGTKVSPDIQGNRFVANSSNTTATPIYRYDTDPGADDYDVSLDVSFGPSANNTNQVIYVGLSDTGTAFSEISFYYIVAANTSSQAWFLGHCVNGSFSETEEEFVDDIANSFRQVYIQYRAGEVYVYIDGVLQMQRTDGPITARGRVALGTSHSDTGHWMDNLHVAAIGAEESEVSGSIDGDLPGITSDIDGSVESSGALSGSLPALTGSLVGQVGHPVSGTLAGTLTALTGALEGASEVSGSVTGTLPELNGSFEGEAELEIGHVAERATGTNSVSATTLSIDLANGSAITQWSLLTLRMAYDNATTGGLGPEASVTDDAGNTWTVLSRFRDPGDANAGTIAALAYAIVENTYSDGDDIDVSFGGSVSVPVKAYVVDEWTGVSRGDPFVSFASNSNGGIGVPSPFRPNVSASPDFDNALLIGVVAMEYPLTDWIEDTDFSWVTLGDAGTSTGDATDQSVYGSWLNVDAGTYTWQPDIDLEGGALPDWAQVLAIFAPQVRTEGPIDGDLPGITGAFEGSVEVSGSVAGVLGAVTGALEGEYPVLAALDGDLGAITGSFEGETEGTESVLTATLPKITGSFSAHTRLATPQVYVDMRPRRKYLWDRVFPQPEIRES